MRRRLLRIIIAGLLPCLLGGFVLPFVSPGWALSAAPGAHPDNSDTSHTLPAENPPIQTGSTPARVSGSNGILRVGLYVDGIWRPVGQLAFDEFPASRSLQLDGLPADEPVRVRITHDGATAAHLDALLLDGQPPSAVLGQMEDESLALDKAAKIDHDLLHITGRTLEFSFSPPRLAGPAILSLTARIEPEEISPIPFQFPRANYYQAMTVDSAFYTYRWHSEAGQLTIDGVLDGEALGRPYFQ